MHQHFPSLCTNGEVQWGLQKCDAIIAVGTGTEEEEEDMYFSASFLSSHLKKLTAMCFCVCLCVLC